MNTSLPSTEIVVRAVFSPLMINESGQLLRTAFSLRHNEGYISVCQMSKASWMDDVRSIPTNKNKVLEGYATLIVDDVRKLTFVHHGKTVSFDVFDKSSMQNKSHAGIVIFYDSNALKGDKDLVLKDLPEDVSAPVVLLRAQRRLLKLANRRFVRWNAKDMEPSPMC